MTMINDALSTAYQVVTNTSCISNFFRMEEDVWMKRGRRQFEVALRVLVAGLAVLGISSFLGLGAVGTVFAGFASLATFSYLTLDTKGPRAPEVLQTAGILIRSVIAGSALVFRAVFGAINSL